mgnify:CR=1 FL=1
MRYVVTWFLVGSIVILCGGCEQKATVDLPKSDDSAKTPVSSKEIMDQRESLDKTVWAGEVDAQKHETVFVRLWDRIRDAKKSGKFAALANFPMTGELRIGTPAPAESLEAGITLTKFLSEPSQTFNAKQWKAFVQSIEQAGVQIEQTEWHHSRFVQATDTSPAKSTISFSIHAIRRATRTTFAVKGNL